VLLPVLLGHYFYGPEQCSNAVPIGASGKQERSTSGAYSRSRGGCRRIADERSFAVA
jgi:hypothetical protein